MKKFLAMVLSLVLALSLAACGGQDNVPAGGDAQQNAGQLEQEAAASGGPVQEEEPALPGEDVPEEDEGAGEEAEGTEEGGMAVITADYTDVTMRTPGNSFKMTLKGWEGDYAATYTSADPAVASVAEDGTVTAVGPGTTTISLHFEGGGIQQDFVCIVRCVWEETGSDTAQPSGELASLADFFSGLQESYEGLGAMMVYEGELLDNYYAGPSGISTKQMLVQETMVSMANCAVALVEVSDSGDVEAVKTILAARAKTQAEGGAWYPASCETWEQAVIVSAGNFVGMFVYPGDAQTMADAFTAAYGG